MTELQDDLQPEKRERKQRSDKGKKRGVQGSTPSKPTTLALEKAEAELINGLVVFLISRKYGESPEAPNKGDTESLAKVIRVVGGIPPFSFIQAFLRRFVPLGGGTGKALGPLGYIIQYAHGWYNKNPDLVERIYLSDPKIPNLPMYPKERLMEKRYNTNSSARVVQDNGPIRGDEYGTE